MPTTPASLRCSVILVLLSGCYASHSPGSDPSEDGGPTPLVDAGRRRDAGPRDAGPPPPTRQLDLLFVIDDSGDLAEEQAALARQLPAMLAILTTGDLDSDGDHSDPDDFAPVDDLHVAVVTTDMGTGGYTIPTCARADFGRDGLFATQGSPGVPGCDARYPGFLTYEARSGSSIDELVHDLSCRRAADTSGCSFEQPLEAALKALTPTRPQPWVSPSFVPVGTPGASGGLDAPFFRNSVPHGDLENSGFLRADSILQIVFLTTEDDCSFADPELFNPMSATYTSNLNLRCASHPSALHPTSRYASGLLQLRRHPSRLLFSAIAGVPVDLALPAGEAVDWEILIGARRDPRMEERVDPAMTGRLVPSCNTSAGNAWPPVRILSAARELESRGASVGVVSICQDDFTGIVRQVARALGG